MSTSTKKLLSIKLIMLQEMILIYLPSMFRWQIIKWNKYSQYSHILFVLMFDQTKVA